MSTEDYPLSQNAAGHKLSLRQCVKSANPVEVFNHFVMAWVDPAWHAHLLDDDDNDGERVRDAIRAAKQSGVCVFPETEVAMRRFRELVDRYYFDAKSDDDRAVIANITGLTRVLQQDVFAWYARELDHWARAARDAEEARDEALALAARADDENARLRAVAEEYEAHRCEGVS